MKKIRTILQILFVACLLFACGAVETALVATPSSSVTATVQPNPLVLTTQVPSRVKTNQYFTISTTVRNVGKEPIKNARASLQAPPDITLLTKQQNLVMLQPREKRRLIWIAKAKNPGSYVIQTKVTGLLGQIQIETSSSNTLRRWGVQTGKGTCDSHHGFLH